MLKRKIFITVILLAVIIALGGCPNAGSTSAGDDNVSVPPVIDIDITSSITDPNPTGSFVAQHGQLHVSGSQLQDASDNPVQLKGMSSFWINWDTGGKFVNEDVINWLVDDWGISLYRVAVGIEPGGAYLDNPAPLVTMLTEVVDACIEKGIYVIIDWHAHDTLLYKEHEIAFFKEVAETYGSYPNVIYELWNEPTSQDWDTQIKPYCEDVIDEIRPIDADSIIVVGTSTWSQDVHLCAANPISGSNIMYTLHFYAGTHDYASDNNILKTRASSALGSGIALFVTEFGTSQADGGQNGLIYTNECDLWFTWMNNNNISWANWSIADKNESSAALKSGASTTGGWSDSNITASGLYIKGKL